MAPNHKKAAREGRVDPFRPTLQRIADHGTAIEDGWQSYRRLTGGTDAEEAYKAGAAFLFQFMIRMLDDGTMETDADLERMEKLHNEVMAIDAAMTLKYGPTKGSG